MIPSTPCSTSDPCCFSLHDIATHLLTHTYDALIECYPPPDCCTPLRAYVTLGNGDDGIVDAVCVMAGGIIGTANQQPGMMNLWRSTFTVRLLESGWPTARVDGDTIVLPSVEEQQAAAVHVYAMGEAMHRRLSYLASKRSLTPSNVRCSNATLGPFLPIPPQGGVAGWQVTVSVDLPWN